jgi:hypothetical protein
MIGKQLRYDAFGCCVPVGAARLGKQIREIFAFTRPLGHRLQAEIGNQPRTKTFPLFNPHRIECTAVRINPDEKFVFWLEVF